MYMYLSLILKNMLRTQILKSWKLPGRKYISKNVYFNTIFLNTLNNLSLIYYYLPDDLCKLMLDTTGLFNSFAANYWFKQNRSYILSMKKIEKERRKAHDFEMLCFMDRIVEQADERNTYGWAAILNISKISPVLPVLPSSPLPFKMYRVLLDLSTYSSLYFFNLRFI